MKILVASRKSALARIQSYLVADMLRRGDPRVEISFLFKSSLGDDNQDQPLWQMPEKGVFTQDLHHDLVEGRCDLVVHSWKDLPVEENKDTEIVATLPRADARDLLLLKESALGHKRLKLLSSSPRRLYNLAPLLPRLLPFDCEVEFAPVRGNVPTRVGKLLADPSAHGLVVAKAGLDRLLEPPIRDEAMLGIEASELRSKLRGLRWMVLPLAENPPAAAQGALAIEIRRDREDLRTLLEALNCPFTFASVRAERAELARHGGGCHQKIGVHVKPLGRHGKVLSLRGQRDDGRVLDRWDWLEDREPAKEKVAAVKLWPEPGDRPRLFQRKAVKAAQGPKGTAYFVARADAWPENWKPQEGDLLWASGTETWAKLARRGFWVHGSAESLGEDPASSLRIMAGDRNWLRLTHETSPEGPTGQTVVATYALAPKDAILLDVAGKTHFFWMSGSLFERVVELHPEIVGPGRHHACGPGRSFELISKKIAQTPEVYLSYSHWYEKKTGQKASDSVE